MKIKYKIVIIMAIILSLSYFDLAYSKTKCNENLFQNIISETNSSVTEYGIKASYTTKINGEKVCLQILNKLGFKNCKDISIVKEKYRYCIEFSEGYKSGYVESIESQGCNLITINMVELKSTNDLKKLRDNINIVINEKNSKNQVKYYQYLKAKTPHSCVSNINKKIVNILKTERAENINTVRISNGYCTVANTRCFSPIKNNGKNVDFNYAVCNYTSGNYIILATPEIITSY